MSIRQANVFDGIAVTTSVALAVGLGLGLACSPRVACTYQAQPASQPRAFGDDVLRFSPATVAFVDGGRTVVLGNKAETLFIDVATANVLHRGLPATVLGPSPDGSLLLAADDSTAPLWDEDQKLVRQLSLRDPQTGVELHSVAVPYMFASSIRWVDATTIAFGDALVPVAALWHDRLAATWPSANDALAGYRLPQEPTLSKCNYDPAYPDVCPPTRRAVPCSLARAPSQKRLVMRLCLGGRAPLRFDDVGQPAQPLQLPDGQWHAFAFLDDQRIVAARYDGPVVIYDLQRNVVEATLPSRAHTALTVAPDGATLATWSSATGVQLWDVTAGHAPRELLPQTGHRSAIAALAFAPDGATLATGGIDGTVRQWRVRDGAQQQVLDVGSPLAGVALANDGHVAFNAYLTVELWDFATRTRLAHTGPRGGSNTNVQVRFTDDNKTIEYQDRDGLGTNRWVPGQRTDTAIGSDAVPAWRMLQSSWEAVERYHRVALRSESGVEVRDARFGQLIAVVRYPDITAMALADDGQLLAVARGNRIIWQDLAAPHTAPQESVLPGRANNITALAIAPDNRSIAVGDELGHLRLLPRANEGAK